MADTRVEMADAAELREAIAAGIAKLFREELGPAIHADAEAGAPKLTGRMSAAIDDEVRREGTDLPYLIVGVFPDAEGPVRYAAAVEYGFHGIETVRAHTRNGHPVREHQRQGNTPEQPFLRPAVYRRRSP